MKDKLSITWIFLFLNFISLAIIFLIAVFTIFNHEYYDKYNAIIIFFARSFCAINIAVGWICIFTQLPRLHKDKDPHFLFLITTMVYSIISFSAMIVDFLFIQRFSNEGINKILAFLFILNPLLFSFPVIKYFSDVNQMFFKFKEFLPIPVNLIGENKKYSLIFVFIDGISFTDKSKKYSESFLSSIIDLQTKLINKNINKDYGYIHNLIGDGAVIIYWNNRPIALPVEKPMTVIMKLLTYFKSPYKNQIVEKKGFETAIRDCLKIKKAIENNSDLPMSEDHSWKIRIGISSGECELKTYGENRKTITVIGNVPNTASRLESGAREENCKNSQHLKEHGLCHLSILIDEKSLVDYYNSQDENYINDRIKKDFNVHSHLTSITAKHSIEYRAFCLHNNSET